MYEVGWEFGMVKQYLCFLAASALTCFAQGGVAQVSSGTAFAVAPERLVTNHHVIAGCASVEIVAADGRRTGSVVDSDEQIDLALLHVTGIKGLTARLRKPRNVRLGESVMVFGFPLTGSLSSGGNFTSGHVSGLRGLRDAAGQVQITAPVQPGNSGGPLMDATGLVIGVVQAKLDALRSAIATGDIPQNVNFAVSLDVLADFLAKNMVMVRDAPLSSPLDTARVAELAQSFTYRVECRPTSRQKTSTSPDRKSIPPTESTPPAVGLPPSISQSRLPKCTGAYDTWTNCFGERPYPSATYVGEFTNGKRDGQGTYSSSNNGKYVGEFKSDAYDGHGTQTLYNGAIYVGEFKGGWFHGKGIFYDPNGQPPLSGIWRFGAFMSGE